MSTVPYPIWSLSDKLESFLSRKHTVKQKESIDEKIKLLLEAETILSRLIEIYTDLSEKYLAEDKKENSNVFFELCDNPIVDFQTVHRIVASEIESNNKGSDDDEFTF